MSLIQEKSACYSSLLIRRSLSPLGEIPKKNATNPKWTPYQAPTSNHAYLSATFGQNISDFFDLYLHWVSVVKDTSTRIFENLKPVEISENYLNILWTSLKLCWFSEWGGCDSNNFFLIYLLVSDFQRSVWECSVHSSSCPCRSPYLL